MWGPQSSLGRSPLRRDIGLELGSLSSFMVDRCASGSPAEVLGTLCAPGAMAVLGGLLLI